MSFNLFLLDIFTLLGCISSQKSIKNIAVLLKCRDVFLEPECQASCVAKNWVVKKFLLHCQSSFIFGPSRLAVILANEKNVKFTSERWIESEKTHIRSNNEPNGITMASAGSM